MNRRRMSLFSIILTGLVLVLVTSPTSAQLLNWTLADLYGAPLYVRDEQTGGVPIGTLFNCQNGSAVAGKSPSDITRVEVYDGLTGAPPSDGILFPVNAYVVAIYTRTPFQQLLGSSYFTSAAIRAIDIGGHSENRMYEINNGVRRIGAADNNFRPIDGTSQLAGVSPDGKAALFSLPAKTTQMFIRTFYAKEAGQPSICYSVTAPDGGPITLPVPWASDSRPNTALVSMTDARDAVIRETGAPTNAPQVDILAAAVYAAPFAGDYAGDYRVDIILTQPLDNTISNWTLNLSVERGSSRGALQNWSLDFNKEQIRNRKLNADFEPLYNDVRFATINEARNVVTFVLPGDVTQIQASASMKTADGQTLYDILPNDKPIDLPALQLASADAANPLLTGQDEGGDTVVCATNNRTPAPEIDITNVTVNSLPANVPVPGGVMIGIQTAQPLVVDPNRASLYNFVINVLHTDGTERNIVVDSQAGQLSSRVLDANNRPVDDQFRYIQAMYRRGYTKGPLQVFNPEDALTRQQMSVFIIRARMNSVFPTVVSGPVVPGPNDNPFFTYIQRLREMRLTLGSHVSAVQVRTSVTTPDGQQFCDTWPASGRFTVPPLWWSMINQARTIKDPAGDTVDAATGAPVRDIDLITSVDAWQIASPPTGQPFFVLGIPGIAPTAIQNRVHRITSVGGGGERQIIVAELPPGEAVDRVLAQASLSPASGRPIYYDPLLNTAYFALPGDTTQATVEVAATTVDGRVVRDTLGPINLPGAANLSLSPHKLFVAVSSLPPNGIYNTNWGNGAYFEASDLTSDANFSPISPINVLPFLEKLFVGTTFPAIPASDPRVFAYFPTSARQGIDNNSVVISPSPAYPGLFDMRMGEDAYNTFQAYRNPVTGAVVSPFGVRGGQAADPNNLGEWLYGAYAKNRLAGFFVGDDRPQQVIFREGQRYISRVGFVPYVQSYNLAFPTTDPYNNLALLYSGAQSDAAPTTPPSGLRTFENPPGGSFACRNPAQPIVNNPAEITRVRVYTVPDNLAALNGYALLIDTRTPFQQLLGTSYSVAISARAVTASGARANRLIEIHNNVTRGGAVDDNGQVIDGTGELVAISKDGAALFYLPAWTTQAQIISFHTATADGTVACSTTQTITVVDAAGGETLGRLLKLFGSTLCPPLDTRLDLNGPLDMDAAERIVVQPLTTASTARILGVSPDATHLRLRFPEQPYDPIANPLVIAGGC